MKTSVVLIICALFTLPEISSAQIELGGRFGLATYMGDLASRPVPSDASLAVGLMMRANITSQWKIRAGLTYGRISGQDRNLVAEERNNLNFRTTLQELSLTMEYDFLPFLPGSNSLTFTPYVFGGVAGFRYDPQANTQGNTYIKLRELGTEGQNIPGSSISPYSNYGIAFPFGLGFKKTVTDQIIFGIEAGLRPTLTDYLDDVSGYYPDFTELAQTENGATAVALSDRRPEIDLEPATAGSLRGNPNNRDWYGFVFITIAKKLGASPCYAF